MKRRRLVPLLAKLFPVAQEGGDIELVLGRARHLAQLVPGDVAHRPLEEGRHALKYVIVELLRNVVQHSHDGLGGVIAAQLMNEQQRYDRPTIQIAVADAGIGIPAALLPRHPRLADAREALEKSLWPHFSGAFDEGLTGSSENAGMGLFIISEMAKLTDGRLLIATRGATLTLHGHSPQFLEPGLGFPGTLVGFELPVGVVADFNSLLEVIKQRARERTPKRATVAAP